MGAIDNQASLKNSGETIKQTANSYKNAEWYKKLSPEKQSIVEKKIEQKKIIEKEISKVKAEIDYKGLSVDIISFGLKKNKEASIDTEDKLEIKSFEERVDMMNRDIDILSRKLYDYKLLLNSAKLTNSFNESNKYFKKGLLKEGEKNPQVLDIIKNKDLKNISAGEIYTLKQEGYDLSKLFLIGAGEEVSKDNMKIRDKFIVNFGGNKDLNRSIGAGDLLPIDKINKVIINGVEGERKLSPRPGYYSADGKYLAIFDNYEIEIVSKKDFTPEEQVKSLEAFKNRYEEIRRPELLLKFREELKIKGGDQLMTLEGISKTDFGIIVSYLNRYLPEVKLNKLKFNTESNSIETKSTETLAMLIDIPVSFGEGYENYKGIVELVAGEFSNISSEKLTTLINHENGRWDPMASAPGSSAYGLGQMIDSTWAIYGKGLDRNNPRDQLEATCKYLTAIMQRKNTPIELAMAYYNTGEGIENISNSKAREYASINPGISKKLPYGISITPKSYFIGAISYYNDISYEQASKLV